MLARHGLSLFTVAALGTHSASNPLSPPPHTHTLRLVCTRHVVARACHVSGTHCLLPGAHFPKLSCPPRPAPSPQTQPNPHTRHHGAQKGLKQRAPTQPQTATAAHALQRVLLLAQKAAHLQGSHPCMLFLACVWVIVGDPNVRHRCTNRCMHASTTTTPPHHAPTVCHPPTPTAPTYAAIHGSNSTRNKKTPHTYADTHTKHPSTRATAAASTAGTLLALHRVAIPQRMLAHHSTDGSACGRLLPD